MKCRIQWIDMATGKPTPDDNEAIGIATSTIVHADGTTDVRRYPICAEHLAGMPHGKSVALGANPGQAPLYTSGWTFTPIDRDLVARYRWFREHGGSWVGRSAEQAIALARAEKRAEHEGLIEWYEDECEPWDGEGPAPRYLLCVVVGKRGSGTRALASLGMVGVDSLHDPYLRVVCAELFADALADIDAERDRIATAGAAELASRATYAGAVQS